ncbi:MAG: hypothetical protein ABIP89_09300, partial [Polyangiaceae bacterium]
MSVDRPPVTTVPRPRPDDIPVVARELTAAVLSWSQHNSSDALSALQRAAEAAAQVGAKPRALELLRAAGALAKIVDADEMKKPVSASEVDEMFEFDEPAQKKLGDEVPTAPRMSSMPANKIEAAKAALKAPSRPSKAPPLPPAAHPPVAAKSEPKPEPKPEVKPEPKPEPIVEAKHVTSDTTQPPSARAFDHVEALADVPDDARDALLAGAEPITVPAGATVPSPDLLVLLDGQLEVRSSQSPCTIETMTAAQLRLLRAPSPASGGLVLVGGPVGAHGLALRVDAVTALRAAAPWVAEEIDGWTDQIHAFAGLFQGKLGSRLDPALLAELRKRVEVRRLRPGTLAVKAAEKVRALVLVGAGELTVHASVAADEPIVERVAVGGVLFAKELAAQLAAPATVRAGANGALLLVAKRNATEEILGNPALRAL